MSIDDGQSLYERLGGAPSIDAAVVKFYDKVFSDPRIEHFFRGVDRAKLLYHQKAFLTFAFRGVKDYPGRSMHNAHAGLNITDAHFNAVGENMRQTLAELGVPPALQDEVMASVESLRDDILNR